MRIFQNKIIWATYALTLLLSALPVILVFAVGLQFFDKATEFVAYRVGDAFSILLHEPQNVHPVQGMATALLSKIIVKILYAIYGVHFADAPVLQLYSAIWFTVIFSIVAFCVGHFWLILTWPQRIGISFLAIVPWYVGGPIPDLLIAPEYWCGEWAYLVCTAAAVPALLKHVEAENNIATSVALIIGAWIGIGVGLKVTLIGVSSLLLFLHPRPTIRQLTMIGCGAALSFIIIDFLYVPNHLPHLLNFQLHFFLFPNDSATYPNWKTAIIANPKILVLAGLVIFLLVAQLKNRATIGLAIWTMLYGYLLWKRPHDTSLTSAYISFSFIIAVLCVSKMRAIFVTLGVASLYLCSVAFHSGLTHLNFKGSEPVDIPSGFAQSGMLLMPNNYWNSGIPAQAFLYNGNIGFYPVRVDKNGALYYENGGKAVQALFGDLFLVGDDESSYKTIESGLNGCLPLFWTRPDAKNDISTLLFLRLKASKAHYQEQVVSIHGKRWLFGKATKSKCTAVARETPASQP